jgi:hypothetical protein
MVFFFFHGSPSLIDLFISITFSVDSGKGLKTFISYFKRFSRDRPADVKSIEEVFRPKMKKKEERRKGEQQRHCEADSPRSRLS